MQEYRLTPAFFKGFKRRQLAARLIVPGVIVGFLFLMAPWKLVLPIALLLLALLLFSGKSMEGAWERSYSTLRITIDTQGIGAVQEGLPEVYLRWEEIVRVVETEGSGLTVFGAQPLQRIGLPVTLENYAEARARIALVKEIQQRRRFAGVLAMLGRILLLVVYVALIAGALFPAVNLWLKLGCCLVLLVILFKLWRMPRVDTPLIPTSRFLFRWGFPVLMGLVLLNALAAVLRLLG